MKPEVLTYNFQKSLKDQGFLVDDIKSDIERINGQKGNPIRVIRNWTGLPNTTIRAGVFNEERDVLSPEINNAILNLLEPWRKTEADQDLPKITVKELSRKTSLSPEKVLRVLSRYPLSFSVNGSSFTTEIQKPVFPNRRLTIADSRDYGLSPSRIARAARYESRAPGGGPVQKAGIQQGDIDKLIRKRAWGQQEVIFNPGNPEPNSSVDYGIMAELEAPIQQRNKTVAEVIYAEPEGQKIMRVVEWFKKVGFGKNWIYRSNEVGFAENLARFSRDEPVDFLIWNCIGFKWFEDPRDEMPTCNINNNLDAAITPYFRDRIQQVAEMLATIGNPELTILLPSNEAFNERVWKYRQPREEREHVIKESVTGLTESFRNLPLPPNARLDVMRWDDYLKSRGADRTAECYSQEGENRVRQSANFERIIREAVKNGRGYFAQNGIKNIRDETFLSRQIMYYGVYAGEGVALEEFQDNGVGVVIVNFEEMRVPQMAFLGSRGSLPIVTPIKYEEMVSYYRWEARQVQKRL